MNKDDVVSTLNELIGTCKDGEHGFKTCTEDFNNPELKSTFSNRAQECAIGATELQQLVRNYGGEPETKSSMSATLHRSWMDLKSSITGKDELGVLEECERGEDIALKSYHNALEEDLPQDVRSGGRKAIGRCAAQSRPD